MPPPHMLPYGPPGHRMHMPLPGFYPPHMRGHLPPHMDPHGHGPLPNGHLLPHIDPHGHGPPSHLPHHMDSHPHGPPGHGPPPHMDPHGNGHPPHGHFPPHMEHHMSIHMPALHMHPFTPSYGPGPGPPGMYPHFPPGPSPHLMGPSGMYPGMYPPGYNIPRELPGRPPAPGDIYRGDDEYRPSPPHLLPPPLLHLQNPQHSGHVHMDRLQHPDHLLIPPQLEQLDRQKYNQTQPSHFQLIEREEGHQLSPFTGVGPTFFSDSIFSSPLDGPGREETEHRYL